LGNDLSYRHVVSRERGCHGSDDTTTWCRVSLQAIRVRKEGASKREASQRKRKKEEQGDIQSTHNNCKWAPLEMVGSRTNDCSCAFVSHPTLTCPLSAATPSLPLCHVSTLPPIPFRPPTPSLT
ncbi:hypothetical protein ACLOJK_006642, partial [Asimina triloba]